MFKKLIYLVAFTFLLYISGNAFAATYTWNGGGTGNDWCTGGNWDLNMVPAFLDDCHIGGSAVVEVTNMTVPGESYAPSAYSLYMSGTSSMIITSTGKYWCRGNAYFGESGSDNVTCTVQPGGWLNGGGKPIIMGHNGAEGTLSIYAKNDSSNLWIGRHAGSRCVVNYDTAADSFHRDCFVGDAGNGTLNMNGGTLVVKHNDSAEMIIANASGSTGHINLNDGAITCDAFSFGAGNGTINIERGTLIIDGDKTITIQGDIDNGLITAYGGNGSFNLDYNTTHLGKTTLTANVIWQGKVTDPLPADGGVGVNALQWIGHPDTDSYKVFISQSQSLVAARDVSVQVDGAFITDTAVPDLAAAAIFLADGQRYYWAVDCVRAGESDLVGDIWELIAAPPLPAGAKRVYVAVNGSDSNSGTFASPFATIAHAQSQVIGGDVVYIRGGTYRMAVSQVALYDGIWAKVTYLNKSGTEGKRINYWAYPGETPVFDYQDITPANYRIHAFAVAGSWIHIKGITVIGVQVTILGHTQSVCFYNSGSNNIYEQLVMRDGQAIGIYAVGYGGDNHFLNCDAYNNWDYTSENGRGGNVDGFGVHVKSGATGNVFEGCRAWFNSDDGYDCINTAEPAIFKNCWAMYNGYTPDFTSRGDGNGFKIGGYAYKPASQLPNPIPRHTTVGCLAVKNKANGFYANHQVGGNDWFYNSSYDNGNNYNMLSRLADPATDVDGYDHLLENNLAHRSNAIKNINLTQCELVNNTFDGSFTGTVSDGSFISLDESQLIASRNVDGSLPDITFLKPTSDSGLEDIGYFARTKPAPLGAVTLTDNGSRVVLENGLVTVEVEKDTGHVTLIKNGNQVYLDSSTGNEKGYTLLATDIQPTVAMSGGQYSVISNTPQQAEISIVFADAGKWPVMMDFHYVITDQSQGFYTYLELNYDPNFVTPAQTYLAQIGQTFRLDAGLFTQGTIGYKNETMPLPQYLVSENQVMDATYQVDPASAWGNFTGKIIIRNIIIPSCAVSLRFAG